MEFESLVLVGMNHKSAPIDVRERVALNEGAVRAALPRLLLSPLVVEAFVLSTCSRTEVMVIGSTSEPVASVLAYVNRFLWECGAVHFAELVLEPYLYSFTAADAVEHLFRVAAGLDSIVLGEGQILGQIRDAVRVAADCGGLGCHMNYLLRQALRVGKRVRAETALGSRGQSVGTAAVSMALRTFGRLDDKTVLTIGAGHTGKLVADALHRAGVTATIVANRTYEGALSLAQAYSARAVRFDDIRLALCEADIAVSSTSAPSAIVKRADIEAILGDRPGRPLLLLDLAVPRDIEASVSELPGVLLFNIDNLALVAEEGLGDARAEAEGMVASALGEAIRWARERSAVPMVIALTAHFERTRQAKLRVALATTPELTEGQRKMMDESTRSIMNKMLHGPIQVLKGQAGYERRLRRVLSSG